MLCDWLLRSPLNPKLGGIPELLLQSLQWASLLGFAYLTFRFLPAAMHFGWRMFIAVGEAALAAVLTLLSWLHYVISNGIDSL
jgi:hypothetical protein